MSQLLWLRRFQVQLTVTNSKSLQYFELSLIFDPYTVKFHHFVFSSFRSSFVNLTIFVIFNEIDWLIRVIEKSLLMERDCNSAILSPHSWSRSRRVRPCIGIVVIILIFRWSSSSSATCLASTAYALYTYATYTMSHDWCTAWYRTNGLWTIRAMRWAGQLSGRLGLAMSRGCCRLFWIHSIFYNHWDPSLFRFIIIKMTFGRF